MGKIKPGEPGAKRQQRRGPVDKPYNYRAKTQGLRALGLRKVLTVDPSGTTISGCMYFQNWGKYKIYSCPNSEGSKNWLDHADFLEEQVKNLGIEAIIIETGKIYNRNQTGRQYSYSFHMDEVIKCAGFCEYLARKYDLEMVKITNQQRKFFERQALEGLIPGLEKKKVKRQFEGTSRVSTRVLWHFREQELNNEHEKDAVLLLYCYIVKKEKKEWPWT